MQNQLSQITWLALSKSLLASQPDVSEQLNQIYSQFLPGYPAGAPANDTVPPPAETTVAPAGGETTPAPAETTVAPAGGETTPAPAETTVAPVPAETTVAPAGEETVAPVEGGRRRRLRL